MSLSNTLSQPVGASLQADASAGASLQADASADVQQRIYQFKNHVNQLLSPDNSSSPPHMEAVLKLLRRAETRAASPFASRRRLAWHELQQAQLALKQQLALRQPDAGASIRIDAQHADDPTFLRTELYDVWNELNELQRQHIHISATDTTDWLMWGREALEKQKPDTNRALYCIMRARCALVYAQECAEWTRWGFVVILLELFYLFLMPIAMYLYAQFNNMTVESVVVDSLATMSQSTALNIPCYVYVWGFLGGTAWCLNYAARWSKKRLFDRHYLAWYIAHPWISAVLGSAVSMIIIGGLAGISTHSIDSPTAMALLSLVSFVAGFSTNSMWKLLDRNVRRVLGDEDPMQKQHRELHKSVVEEIKR
jgi:hypothetical protein